MPFYFRTGIGPIRYSHRISGRRRPRRAARPRYAPQGYPRIIIVGYIVFAVVVLFWLAADISS